MDLLIEKAFLDDFYHKINLDNLNTSQKCVLNFIKEYGNINTFLDFEINSPEDLAELKLQNIVFSYLINDKPFTEINSVKETFFSKNRNNQTLIFCRNNEKWFSDAENLGAFCFSLDNYEIKIAELISHIDSINIDIEDLKNWKYLTKLKAFPITEIQICDPYLFANRGNRIKNNLIPILESLIVNRIKTCTKLKIYAGVFLPNNFPESKGNVITQIEKNNNLIQSELAGGANLEIETYSTSFNGYDFHARELVTSYFIITSGRGFNLFPRKQKTNEIITSNSIFSKLGYNRINKRFKLYQEYQNKLRKLESINFRYHPEE